MPDVTAGAPSWLVWIIVVLTAVGGLGGLAALIGSVLTYRLGVRGHEQEARAEEETGTDRLLGRLEQRLAEEVARRQEAETEAQTWERRYRAAYRYAETLRRILWGTPLWEQVPPRPDEE